ncbi:MAG: hypothetical protein ACREP5_15900, partial [Candidatus Binatia bacterium]
IVTDDQVEQGIRLALARVKSNGVLIEGTSFLKFIKPDFAVMVARADQTKIKPSARRALQGGLIDSLYLSGEDLSANVESSFPLELVGGLPVYTQRDLPRLVSRIHQLD